MNNFGFFEINVIHEIFKPLFAINDINRYNYERVL